jgi:hypothetical protein
MKIAVLTALCCLVAFIADAGDTNLILTANGVTYSNVTFRTVTPSTVTIFHSTGIATVSLAALPTDVQKSLEYDPEKARAYELELAKREAGQTARLQAKNTFEERVKNAESAVVRVNQVMEDGLLVQFRRFPGNFAPRGILEPPYYETPVEEWIGPIAVRGVPNSQHFAENDERNMLIDRVGIYTFIDTQKAKRQVPAYEYLGTWEHGVYDMRDTSSAWVVIRHPVAPR